jgi:integrase
VASIQKRPDGRWRARFRDVDNKEHAHHAPTKAAAQRWLDEQTAKLVRGEYVDPRAGRITVETYAAQWLARRTWAPATHDRIDRELRLHILPAFGKRPLTSLRRAHLEEWAKHLSLAPSSARATFETFSAMLSAAVDDERLARNPAKGARLARVDAAPFVPLTTEDVLALEHATAEHVRAAVTLAAGTGLRQGELFGLAVDRVDFLRRELRVDQQLWTPPRGAPVLKSPKSANSYRTIALSDIVVDALAAHVAAFGAGEHGLMFHTEHRPVGRSMASKYLRTPAEAAGLEGRTWHDLRHFHASMLLSRGVSPAYVAERLGHDVRTLLATYAHVIRADEDRVRRIVDETLSADSADFSRTAEG